MEQGPETKRLAGVYRAYRVRLNMIASGTTTAWSSEGGGKPGTKPPTTGEPGDDLAVLDRRWEDAKSDADRREVVKDTRFLLRCWNGEIARERRADLGRCWEDSTSRDERMLKEGRGWEPKLVAVAFKCGEKDVLKARLAAGLDPSTGEPVEGADRMVVVRQLHAVGVSNRQIAGRVGVSHVTVANWLKKAA